MKPIPCHTRARTRSTMASDTLPCAAWPHQIRTSVLSRTPVANPCSGSCNVAVRTLQSPPSDMASAIKHLNERGAQVGDERAVQVALGRNRNGGGFLSALKPQFPLVPPLMQVADVWRNRCAPERLPDSLIRRGLDPIRCHGEVRVGPQVGGNFRSLGLVNAD